MKIYGSKLCPDCVQCLKELDASGISYEYLDFADNLKNLKEFLALRDADAVFSEVRSQGCIGIPAIVLPDGTVCLSWDNLL